MSDFKFLMNDALFERVGTGLYIIIAVTVITVIAAAIISAYEVKKQRSEADAGKTAADDGGVPDTDDTH